jgi:two-component system response regulator YesN
MYFIIADKSAVIRDLLIQTLKQNEMEFFVNSSGNENEFLQYVDLIPPNLVIFDINEFDAAVIVNSARKRNPHCRFIALCSKKNFNAAFNAVKLKIDEFFLKPVKLDELRESLERIKQYILMDKKIRYMDTVKEELISALFFRIAGNSFSLKPLTITTINMAFGTAMQTGYFRLLCVRFDYVQAAIQEKDALLEQQGGCLKILRSNLQDLCYDCIFDNNIFQCRLLINYPAEREAELNSLLEKSLKEIQQQCPPEGLADAAAVTMALSLPFTDFAAFPQAGTEVMEANWLRFSKGTGKIIYWEKPPPLSASYIRVLQNYQSILKKACVFLDIDSFTKKMKELCSQPRRILLDIETRVLLSKIEQYMYEINKDIISAFSDVSLVHQQIREANQRSVTLEEFLNSYIVHLTSLFERVIEYAPKNSKYIRQAHYYVDQNMGKAITLTDVADEFGINPVYFSHLYKQTTGKNFTDFVTERKIGAAKTYLEQKKIKILDVAAMTGFSNPKYFARAFKEQEGLTPSEYRKIHS